MPPKVIVRMADPEWSQLRKIAFARYPTHEWATFARFGWREGRGTLVLTLASLDEPKGADLDSSVGNVAFQEPYSLRIALAAEKHNLAVGVVHSHPEGCRPVASHTDDDMDSYYSSYLGDFAPGRPYVSLILAIVDGELAISGRVWWKGDWHVVEKFATEGLVHRLWVGGTERSIDDKPHERTKRLSAGFGMRAAARLKASTVAVVGAGGTGSAAIEVLARAGVGRLVVVDPEVLTESNLERVHGSKPEDVSLGKYKVELALEHVRSIDPSCVVEAYVGALPQEDIIEALTTCDIALGCTDQQHSRLALSDIAIRYLLPTMDCGVGLEGEAGRLTGHVIQIVRFLAADPCVLCRNMIDASQVFRELMSEEERAQRQAAAKRASAAGGAPQAYWQDLPQLNTVGYLTTTAGAMLAGYAIGLLAGVAKAPFRRLQMNLGAPLLDVTDQDEPARPVCPCRKMRGLADQGKPYALITAPSHWPAVRAVLAPRSEASGRSILGIPASSKR